MRLERVLRTVLAEVGADTARVVDGPTGTVIAAVGDPVDDGLATLLGRTGGAPPKAGDLVVRAAGAVHVLRGLAGLVVHVRLAMGADVAAARRTLGDAGLHAAVRSAVTSRIAEAGASIASRAGLGGATEVVPAMPPDPAPFRPSPFPRARGPVTSPAVAVPDPPPVPAPAAALARRPTPRRSAPGALRGRRPAPRRRAPDAFPDVLAPAPAADPAPSRFPAWPVRAATQTAAADLSRGTLPALARTGTSGLSGPPEGKARRAEEAAMIDMSDWSRDVATLSRLLAGLRRMA